MKKLKNISRDPPTAHQEEQLSAWLNEWTLHLELCAIDGEPGGDEELTGTAPVDLPAAAGQIRLLPPVSTALKSRLVYAALLQPLQGDLFLVAPFSRFAVPATPGELSTGRACAAVRVLCLWNACEMTAEMLKSTWLVDEMSSNELSEAMAVYRHSKDGAGLPKGLSPRTGPPLFHPADPRQVYVNRERAFWNSILEDSASIAQRMTLTHLPWLEKPVDRKEMRIAAEGAAVYAVAKRFSVENSDLVIVVSFDDEARMCRFLVQASDDKICAELNSCRIETPSGEACIIENCRAAMPADGLRGGFRMTDIAGRPLVLYPLN